MLCELLTINMEPMSGHAGLSWYSSNSSSSYNAFSELLAAPQVQQLDPTVGDAVFVQPSPHVQYISSSVPQGTTLFQSESAQQHHVQRGSQGITASAAFGAATSAVKAQDVGGGIKASKGRLQSPAGERIECHQCGATFACGANLRNHLRIHTGERPYKCEECGVSFTQRSNLHSHKRVHTGERPYMCGICGQTFARSSHLPGHMRTHTGEKPFACPQCGRAFATNQIMKNHLRTHTGERPFVCDVCEATFAQSSCLATHKKIHTGERNFKCYVCGKAFISRSGLQTHERVHTGEKPYQCEKCNQSFKTSSYLSKHKQKYCGNNGYKNCIKRQELMKCDLQKGVASSGGRNGRIRKGVRTVTRLRKRGRPRRAKKLVGKVMEESDVDSRRDGTVIDKISRVRKYRGGLPDLEVQESESKLQNQDQEEHLYEVKGEIVDGSSTFEEVQESESKLQNRDQEEHLYEVKGEIVDGSSTFDFQQALNDLSELPALDEAESREDETSHIVEEAVEDLVGSGVSQLLAAAKYSHDSTSDAFLIDPGQGVHQHLPDNALSSLTQSVVSKGNIHNVDNETAPSIEIEAHLQSDPDTYCSVVQSSWFEKGF